MNELRVAQSAGFCFGVSRSVKMAEELIAARGKCCSLGELIHNRDVVEKLMSAGMTVVESAAELAEGEHVLIRAHGVGPAVYDALNRKNAIISDATCPKVKAIHKIVSNDAANGRTIIIIGMRTHPEVIAICGWAGEKHFVVENLADTMQLFDDDPELCSREISVVVQTTQTESNFKECSEFIKKLCTNVKISDTICNATSMRQQEAAEISKVCDAMVVIGGKHSANSVHLAHICRQYCDNVQFIEKPSELRLDMLSSAKAVGLTAGASTPAWIIKEVRNIMSDEIKVAEATAETEEMSFEEMLNESIKPIYNGDKVTGIVVAITGTEVSLDIGAKYSGFIPTTEFTDDGTALADAVKIGDEIEAQVVRVNDVEGTAQLSKKRLDAAKVWTDVEAAVEDGTVLEGTVTEVNKGGVVVMVKGLRVFVPASQTDLPKDADLNQLLKTNVKLKITEVNKARKRIVGSIRVVARAERAARRDSIWNEIEAGKKYTGTVKSLTSYGAFVDIGGIDGMVHVSELSWGRIHQPSEIVSVGDTIEVYVIDFDKEKRRISLGYKDPETKPWTVFMNQYAVGDTARVKVVKLMTFGAFAEVVPGVDGLIHISQIANRRIEKPEDVLTVGDEVDAKITAIDEEKQKISLSIRALIEEPAEAAEEVEVEE